jgi:hypothetical protein
MLTWKRRATGLATAVAGLVALVGSLGASRKW